MNSQQVWEIFLRQLMQLSIVIAAAWGAARVVRGRPHLVYALWVMVLVKAVTPPISSGVSLFSWPDFKRVEALAAQPVIAEPMVRGAEISPGVIGGDEGRSRLQVGLRETSALTLARSTGGEGHVAALGSGRRVWSVSEVLLGCWGAGACLTLMYVLGRWWMIRRWIEKLAVRAPMELVNLVQEQRSALGLRRGIRLKVCNGSVGPAVFGVFRPALVIPAAILRERDLGQIRAILAHEMIHLRRGDPLAAGLQVVSRIVWWFHPLVWWMNREIGRVRELCCDAEVLGLGCQPGDYAQMLIDILRLRRGSGPGPGLVSMGVDPAQVTAHRLRKIMSGGKWTRRRMPWKYWAVVAMWGLLILPGAGMVMGDGGEQMDSARVRWDGYPRVAPFDAVRWNERTPQVRVDGTWYELLGVNGVPASEIVNYSYQLNPRLAKKHFGEDLVELLTLMGHTPGDAVSLKVKDLSSGKEQTLENVAMTGENREAVFNADLPIFEAELARGSNGGVSYELRHFVRVVVGLKGITYQGREISRDQLPALLQQVQDPGRTVVEVAVASEDVTVGRLDEVEAVAGNEVQRLGFSYLSYIGKQDAHSKGSADQMILSVSGQKAEVYEPSPIEALPALKPAAEPELTHVVKFQLGKSEFRAGDGIAIKEVRGTSDEIQVDGTYQVIGTYTLASRDRGSVSISVTATNPKDGWQNVGPWEWVDVKKGSGSFKVTMRMPCEGYLHVSLNSDGKNLGTVYFGTGETVGK
jgi:beta-lactamase regulating signal transducer with metallopeptidase domain